MARRVCLWEANDLQEVAASQRLKKRVRLCYVWWVGRLSYQLGIFRHCPSTRALSRERVEGL